MALSEADKMARYNRAIKAGATSTQATRAANPIAAPRPAPTVSSTPTRTYTPTTTTRMSGATTSTDSAGNRTTYKPTGEVLSNYNIPTKTFTTTSNIKPIEPVVTNVPEETTEVDNTQQVIQSLLTKLLGQVKQEPINQEQFMADAMKRADLGASLKYDSIADNLKTRTQNILNDLTNRIGGLDREYAPALTDLRNQRYQTEEDLTRRNVLRGIQGTGVGEAEQTQLDAIYGGQRSGVLRDRIGTEQELRTEMMNVENTLNQELANIDRDRGTYKEQALLEAKKSYDEFIRTGNQQNFENTMAILGTVRALGGDEEAIRQFNEQLGLEREKVDIDRAYKEGTLDVQKLGLEKDDELAWAKLAQEKELSDADRKAKIDMFTANLLQENDQFLKDYGLRKSDLINKHMLGLKQIDIDEARLGLMNKEIDNAFKIDNMKINADKTKWIFDRADRLNQWKIDNENTNRELTLKENAYDANEKQAVYNYLQKMDSDIMETSQAIKDGVVSDTEGAYMISDILRTAQGIVPIDMLQQKANTYKDTGLIDLKDKTKWDTITNTIDYWTKDLGTYYGGLGDILSLDTAGMDELIAGGNKLYETTTSSGIYNNLFDDILNR